MTLNFLTNTLGTFTVFVKTLKNTMVIFQNLNLKSST